MKRGIHFVRTIFFLIGILLFSIPIANTLETS
jgi:hypothetical protein